MIITFGKPDLPTLLAMKLDCNLSRVKPYNPLDIEHSGLIITLYLPIDTSSITPLATSVRVSRRFKLRPGSSAIPPLRLSERLIMASRRLSRLQRHSLKCLMADYRRTQGGTLLGHYELVQSWGRDKSNVSHSLRTLEARGLIVISRTSGGQANTVDLTSEGRNVASELE